MNPNIETWPDGMLHAHIARLAGLIRTFRAKGHGWQTARENAKDKLSALTDERNKRLGARVIAQRAVDMSAAVFVNAVLTTLATTGHTGPLSIGEQKFIAGCQSRGMTAADCALKIASWNGPLTSIFNDGVRV